VIEAPPPIDSRAGYRAALCWGFQTAIQRGARTITCVDPDFAEWPLDDPALLQALTAWLRLPQRRLVLLAADYRAMPRALPRFTAWRSHWVHAMAFWQAAAEMAADLPSLLLDDRGLSVRLIDAEHWRGSTSLDARTALPWRERTELLLQRAEAAFAVNTLGL
jgi:hypothetical protein